MHYLILKTQKMKKQILKTASFISLFSVSFLTLKPALSDVYQYGSNSTRPDSFKVTFYELGLTNSDFTKVFSVLDSESGVEVDISDQNSINNMASGVTPVTGTYTHLYAVIDTTYKLKGSSNGCYTKNTSVNQSDGGFDAATSTKNGDVFCTSCTFDSWSAATSNSSEFGEAIITEQTFSVGSNGEPDSSEGYGPVTPATNISVGGNEVSSATTYLTNSSNPYSFVASGTAISDLPASSTRDRALYIGELSSQVIVDETSSGTVQIYFDYSNGLAFDDDCDSIKINSGDFDMSVITE